MLIDSIEVKVPVYRQCELVNLARSSWYYKSVKDDTYNEHLMRLIDEQYTLWPFYGSPRMTAWLRREGYRVNHKRVERLMRVMGIEAIYPKRKLSTPDVRGRKFPYLLRGLEITDPDQVWCTDVTYIRLRAGFVYLVVIMDWASRYVISWELSNTLDTDFCVACLDEGLRMGKPRIFNSDQGSQFTSEDFIGRLELADIRISMDGRGRVHDNIFVERLWRTVKYEEVYIHDYEGVRDTCSNLERYFHFYNTDRIHESLGYMTPHEVYFGESKIITNNRQADKSIHLKEANFLS